MKELAPDSQAITLVILFILGNSSIVGLAGRAGNDIWLAFILAMIMALPIITIHARVRSLIYNQTIGEGLASLYGKWPTRLLALGFGFFAWRLTCFVAKDISEFVQTAALKNTPQVVVVFFFLTLAAWAAKEGIEVLCRFTAIFIKGIFFSLAMILILLLTLVDFKEFLPILYHGFKPVFFGALELADVPFLETIVLFGVFDRFTAKNSPYKILLPGFLIAAFSLMFITNISLAVLGAESYVINYFPVFVAVSKIDLARFLTRLEAFVGIAFSLGAFIKISACLMAASKGLAIAFGFQDYRFLVTPLALAAVPGSQWLIKTIMQLDKNITKVLGPTELIVQAGVPILLWIIAEIRMYFWRKNGKKGGKPTAHRQ